MNRLFSQLIEQNTPQLNPEIMNGLACTYMQKTEDYLDEVFRSANQSFPEGLEYIGYERCTPVEEYDESTKAQNNKRSFDLARSDLYMVKFLFTFQGQRLPPRYIYLPYVSAAGIFSLGGAKFHLTPVLSDKVISPGYDSIFVRLLRDKIIFKRCYHTIVYDNKRETNHVIWSSIYRKIRDTTKKVPVTTRSNTSLPHYLFAKYGFSKTFEKYAGFVPITGYEEINTTKYPEDQWVVCESACMKPKTYIGDYYTPNNIKLAIPRQFWNNMTKGLVVGFYYILDHFPQRLKPEYLDNTHLWMILLGHIVFSGLFGENKLYTQIQEHFMSLDEYIDTIVIKKLKENGYVIHIFYDLLALVVSEFNNFVLESTSATNSMTGKSLEILYYALFDITRSFFRVGFRLGKQASKKQLTAHDITECFNREMKKRSIFKLASGKIFVESISYSGDHKYPKITSKITEQETQPGGTRGKSKRLSVGVDKHLDISMVENGSVLFLSKSNPSPTNRINPCLHVDLSTGTIIPNPKFAELRLKTQQTLTKGLSELINVVDINEGDEDDITVFD